jgi:hypothetical protein
MGLYNERYEAARKLDLLVAKQMIEEKKAQGLPVPNVEFEPEHKTEKDEEEKKTKKEKKEKKEKKSKHGKQEVSTDPELLTE